MYLENERSIFYVTTKKKKKFQIRKFTKLTKLQNKQKDVVENFPKSSFPVSLVFFLFLCYLTKLYYETQQIYGISFMLNIILLNCFSGYDMFEV